MASLYRECLCWEVDISCQLHPRVLKIHEKLRGSLKSFQRDLSDVHHPLKKEIEGLLIREEPYVKLFVFARDKIHFDQFTERNNFTRKSEPIAHDTPDGFQDSFCKATGCSCLVILVNVITKDEISAQQIDIDHFLSNMCPIKQDKIKNKLLTMMEFLCYSKEDIQENLNAILDLASTCSSSNEPKGCRIFYKNDSMFRGKISRYIECGLLEQLHVLASSLDELINFIPPKTDAITNVLKDQNILIVFCQKFEFVHNKSQKIPRSEPLIVDTSQEMKFVRQFREHAVAELGIEVIRTVFNFEDDEGSENASKRSALCQSPRKATDDITKNMMKYLQSFLTGMLVSLVVKVVNVKDMPDKDINSEIWRKNNARALADDVNREERAIANEIMKEIEQLVKTEVLKKWKLILQELIEQCTSSDEIPYDVQISISRIPGVKSFGILDRKFTISAEHHVFRNNKRMMRDVKEAVGKFADVDVSSLREWKGPRFHYKNGDIINGEGCRHGMITLFAKNEDYNGPLYFITCQHVAPKTGMRVYFSKCTRCRDSLSCTCEKEVLGINFYPFGIEKGNDFGALIDITCGKVNEEISSHCDRNVRGKYQKLIDTDFNKTIESHTGKPVLKWNTNEEPQRGHFYGVQYVTPNETTDNRDSDVSSINIPFGACPRRVDIIKGEEGVQFGREGESGALIFLLEMRTGNSDLIAPSFVYLGQWDETDNSYMCYRLREGLDCITMEHNVRLSPCLENPKASPSIVSSHLGRKRCT